VTILNSILKSGVGHAYDSLAMRRIVFFNYLVVFSVVGSVSLGFLISGFNFLSLTAVCFAATILYTVCLVLNRKGKFEISKHVFLISSVVLIFLGTYINIQSGLIVESENLLLALMAICMFIFDGKRKHVFFWSVFGFFIFLKNNSLGVSSDPDTWNYACLLYHSYASY